jgi:hypothetical protein
MSEWIIKDKAYKENKILLTIAHYGSTNRNYFLECLKEYNSYNGCRITVHLLLTEDIDCSAFSNLNIVKHIYPLSIEHDLVHEYKPIFSYEAGNFDYYIYCEDDVMITKENFDVFVSVQENLILPYVCGFLRYELKENDNYKYLIDNHPVHSCHRGGNTIIKENYTINGEPYFEVYNIHQGCHILTKATLEYLKTNSNKYFDKISNYAGVREGAASDVYFNCGLIKVIPRNRVSELVVHHMANKYVQMHPEFYIQSTTPDDVKIATLQS